jgi:hypothetical protein
MRTLRVLAILTKRQMIDNAAYLVPAVLFSLVFVPAVAAAVLTDDLTVPSSHSVIVFVSLPILLCVGSCALGIAQARADRINGASEWLATWAVPRTAVLCARIAVGVFVILIATAPLALMGVILWRIVGPPGWLVRDWQADVFSGMFLVALVSYSLGLSGGTRARTSFRACGVVPLVLLLVLLIVAKGFGWVLLSILLAILVALILESIRSCLPSYLSITVVGLLTIVFASMALFWGRFLCDAALSRVWYEVEMSPSGLLAEKENSPAVSSQSALYVVYSDWRLTNTRLFMHLYRRHGVLSMLCSPFEGSERLLRHLGIAEYARSRKRGNSYVNDRGREGFEFAHLDYVDGRLVYRYRNTRALGSTFPRDWERATIQYVGPEGVSDSPTGAIGRFAAPLVGASEFVENREWWSPGPTREDLNTFTLFDTQSRCFSSIDLGERIVSRGPRLGPRSDEPVQVGVPPGRDDCRIDVRLPRDGRGSEVIGFAKSPYVRVVRASGRIELLDKDRLEIVGSAGTLPHPPTLFGRGSRKPHDVLASDVALIAVGAPRRNSPTDRLGRGEYVGAVAASVSRQGTSVSVAVFDKQGRMIGSYDKGPSLPLRRLVAKYVFESLHPPILTLVSFFAAYSFEAGATHRALFLMPNSFVALQRDRETEFIFQLLFALLFLLPALAFAGFLSWRIVRDAPVMGLPRHATWLWGIGTLSFGLPAYIAHRLTRPRAALALCPDCGQSRRVDQEACHHCGNGWNAPVLEPPAWRITSP